MNRVETNSKTAHGVLVTLSVLALLAVSCSRAAPKIDAAGYAGEIEQWRAQRLADLKSDNGWLTLIGLFWLKQGENKLGSDPANDIVLPKDKVSARSSAFLVNGRQVRFETRLDKAFTVEGKPVTALELKSDAEGKPTVLHLGTLRFQIIVREDKIGLRVKDSENPARKNFPGLQFYPSDLKWRIDARFEAYNPPKPMPIMNVLGMETDETSPGAVVFEANGQAYRLDAITEKGEPKLFMIFADKTSGKETYGAGRYLYVDPPDSAGRIVIDFNKAYSPPCAFTNYATCPLPPDQNRLSLPIEAGEKYSEHPK